MSTTPIGSVSGTSAFGQFPEPQRNDAGFSASLDRAAVAAPSSLPAAAFSGSGAVSIAAGKAVPMPGVPTSYLVTRPDGDQRLASGGPASLASPLGRTSSTIVVDLALATIAGQGSSTGSSTPGASLSLQQGIGQSITSALGGRYGDVAVTAEVAAAINSIAQTSAGPGGSLRTEGWAFSPRVFVSTPGSDAFRNSARSWAGAEGEAPKADVKVDVGFSLQSPRAIVLALIQSEAGKGPELSVFVLASGSGNFGAGAAAARPSVEKGPSGLSVSIPGSGIFDVPRAIGQAVDNLVSAAAAAMTKR